MAKTNSLEFASAGPTFSSGWLLNEHGIHTRRVGCGFQFFDPLRHAVSVSIMGPVYHCARQVVSKYHTISLPGQGWRHPFLHYFFLSNFFSVITFYCLLTSQPTKSVEGLLIHSVIQELRFLPSWDAMIINIGLLGCHKGKKNADHSWRSLWSRPGFEAYNFYLARTKSFGFIAKGLGTIVLYPVGKSNGFIVKTLTSSAKICPSGDHIAMFIVPPS